MWDINPVEKINRKQSPNFNDEFAEVFRPIKVMRDLHENNVWYVYYCHQWIMYRTTSAY